MTDNDGNRSSAVLRYNVMMELALCEAQRGNDLRVLDLVWYAWSAAIEARSREGLETAGAVMHAALARHDPHPRCNRTRTYRVRSGGPDDRVAPRVRYARGHHPGRNRKHWGPSATMVWSADPTNRDRQSFAACDSIWIAHGLRRHKTRITCTQKDGHNERTRSCFPHRYQ